MDDWDIVVWAVVAALAFVGELLTVSFFLFFFSLGAVVALVMALVGITSLTAQIAGFIAASILSMVVLRPALVNRISLRSSERYEVRGKITGKNGVATEEIEPGGSGTVRIGSGEFWTARSIYPDQWIQEGSRVRVLHTDGLTALVEPIEDDKGGT
ncbi:hypothetical protein BH18ACT10_BH18ACT10_00480 [soil metagenome]|nr:NfeD family protein [Rubrobacter sp.]MBA4115483.1 NfeD family protein [Rubrobacter sp.]